MAPERTEQNQEPEGMSPGPAAHRVVFEEAHDPVGRGADTTDSAG